uniref:Uncharacterized protein n=1 Tax=Vespula pensylvanica TaxID=30213 RepID=A0A834NZZ0_VESPE|nr:hypothetical protein H0235_009794 [Vespula pensylvanica]
MCCRCPSQYGTLRTECSLNGMKFAHRTASKLSLRIRDHVCKTFYVKKDARQTSPLEYCAGCLSNVEGRTNDLHIIGNMWEHEKEKDKTRIMLTEEEKTDYTIAGILHRDRRNSTKDHLTETRCVLSSTEREREIEKATFFQTLPLYFRDLNENESSKERLYEVSSMSLTETLDEEKKKDSEKRRPPQLAFESALNYT